MKHFTFPYVKRLDENGITATINIDFIPNEEKTQLELLQCTISTGCQAVDYAFIVDKVTLKDLIEELFEYYNW